MVHVALDVPRVSGVSRGVVTSVSVDAGNGLARGLVGIAVVPVVSAKYVDASPAVLPGNRTVSVVFSDRCFTFCSKISTNTIISADSGVVIYGMVMPIGDGFVSGVLAMNSLAQVSANLS